jgi:ribosomal protein S27E
MGHLEPRLGLGHLGFIQLRCPSCDHIRFHFTFPSKTRLCEFLGAVILHPLWLNSFENHEKVLDFDLRKYSCAHNLGYNFTVSEKLQGSGLWIPGESIPTVLTSGRTIFHISLLLRLVP